MWLKYMLCNYSFIELQNTVGFLGRSSQNNLSEELESEEFPSPQKE